MLDLFTNREIASGIYIIFFIIFIFTNKNTRGSGLDLLRIVLSRRMLIVFMVLILYLIGVLALLRRLPIWEMKYIKEIIFWFSFAGMPMCFKAISNKDEHYYLNSIIDKIKFTAIVEYLVGTYSFSLWLELILLPVITIVLFLKEYANHYGYEPIGKLCEGILVIYGGIILIATIREVVTDLSNYANLDTLIIFCLPLVFSLLYLPFAYLFAVYAKYEVVIFRIKYGSDYDCKTIWQCWFKLFSLCGLSFSKINGFEKYYSGQIYRIISKEDLWDVIEKFRSE